MNNATDILAIRYAHAFLNLFDDSITADTIPIFCRVALFFKNNHNRLALLLAPYLNKTDVITCITKICKKAGLPDTCQPLIRLLVQMNRLELLPDVFMQISEQYKMRHTLFDCSIISSHPLTKENKQCMSAFIDRSVGHTYTKKYEVDKTLIAGIRIVGDTIFWEYSVRRYLAEIGRTIIR